ncbi:hypothetical protein CEE35_01970 [Candidatus Aerophobetes bacterium Ae_b3b]|nr:MAG: hypothetical protein CEE35_01970 [Candidatus Aerophobetes bacterium Ae_b3b]
MGKRLGGEKWKISEIWGIEQDELEEKRGYIQVNNPTAKLWDILNCMDNGTPSPYNPCHSSPQQAEGYSGIFL